MGLSAQKIQSIQTLGMGTSVKFQLQFGRRYWNELGCNGEIRLPSPAFQTSWGRDARPARHAGRVQFLVGRLEGHLRERQFRHEFAGGICLGSASEILPGLGRHWNGLSIIDIRARNPWSLGSYSYFPIGYWTTLLGIEALPEGNVYFAGEHTWS